ncbi:hypothetical protein QBC44DRAFT_354055 [Cladorrhinum sp. PSN332]|nr:hypothetical protein QBC44DRAFT_354055 [Cladorrhinum sp. PSN332]
MFEELSRLKDSTEVGLVEKYPKIATTPLQAGHSQTSVLLPVGIDMICKNRQQIIDRIRFEHMEARFDSIPEAAEGTFRWCIESSELPESHPNLKISFRDWLARGFGVFHISGKPGSGKSTLMKFVARHPETESQLRRWAGPSRTLVLASFYSCGAGSQRQKSLEGLVRSIAYTVFSKLPHLISELFKNHWIPEMTATSFGANGSSSKAPKIPLEEVFTALGTVLRGDVETQSCALCLFIDALDEFDDPTQTQSSLAQRLLGWTRANPTGLKICVSSRSLNPFMDTFTPGQRLCMHLLTKNDIELFVSVRLNHHPGFLAEPEDSRKGLVDSLVQRGEGVFLWVRLALDRVLAAFDDGDSFDEISGLLAAFPRDMEDVFESMLMSASSPLEHREGWGILAILGTETNQYAESGGCRLGLLQLSFLDDYLRDNQFAMETLQYTLDPVTDEAQRVTNRIDKFITRLSRLTQGLVDTHGHDHGHFLSELKLFHHSAYQYLQSGFVPSEFARFRNTLNIDKFITQSAIAVAKFVSVIPSPAHSPNPIFIVFESSIRWLHSRASDLTENDFKELHLLNHVLLEKQLGSHDISMVDWGRFEVHGPQRGSSPKMCFFSVLGYAQRLGFQEYVLWASQNHPEDFSDALTSAGSLEEGFAGASAHENERMLAGALSSGGTTTVVGSRKDNLDGFSADGTTVIGSSVQGKSIPPANAEADDTRTVYSEDWGTSSKRYHDDYIDVLAEELATQVGVRSLDDEQMARLSIVLPALLKTMALCIGFNTKIQARRDIMVFIHKHRNPIADAVNSQHKAMNLPDGQEQASEAINFVEEWLGNVPSDKITDPANTFDDQHIAYQADNIEDSRSEFKADSEPVQRLGRLSPDDAHSPSIAGSSNHGGVEQAKKPTVPGLEDFKKLVSGDDGYDWLLGSLHREITLARPADDIMGEIRHAILTELPKAIRLSRKLAPPSQGCAALFSVDWDPVAFLRDQEFEEPFSDSIAKAIAITGFAGKFQALSCMEYMVQTWPKTGSHLVKLLQKLLTPQHLAGDTSRPLKGLAISASLANSTLDVFASGVPDLVAEIGEQLAWVGAALRPPDRISGQDAIYCVPSVNHLPAGHPTTAISQGFGDAVSFSINFKFESCKKGKKIAFVEHDDGECWLGLFNRPVIAKGFPIPRRPEGRSGLEMPLNMMAALARTKYVNTFRSKLFIKGFSTMLVPTLKDDDVLMWHFLHSSDPEERISYLECPVEHADIKTRELESSRHILGWCTKASCAVGTAEANYSIQGSNLPQPRSANVLEKVEFSLAAPQFVTGTAVFGLGKKQGSVHTSRGDYIKKLSHISKKHFVLWDEEEKRGWLVNGASTLLHVLRANLKYTAQKLETDFLLEPTRFPSVSESSGPNAAFDVLKNVDFRRQRLWISEVGDSPDEDKHCRLQDQVEYLYNTLEKMMDNQTEVEQQDGIKVSPRTRKYLHGWDFRDLATDEDPIQPRACTLNAWGNSWVDLVRGVHAVTLFGRGFGDLIRPNHANPKLLTPRYPATNTQALCRWAKLPSRRYYLAARITDLQEMIERQPGKSHDVGPVQLCGKVFWHVRHEAFNPCNCLSSSKSGRHDPVQALFPNSQKWLHIQKSSSSLPGEAGAVIFGHSWSLGFALCWPDQGDPEPGKLDSVEDGNVEAGSIQTLSTRATISRIFSKATTDTEMGGSTGRTTPLALTEDRDDGSRVEPLEFVGSNPQDCPEETPKEQQEGGDQSTVLTQDANNRDPTGSTQDGREKNTSERQNGGEERNVPAQNAEQRGPAEPQNGKDDSEPSGPTPRPPSTSGLTKRRRRDEIRTWWKTTKGLFRLK